MCPPQPISEYPFAAFNKKAAILKYSPEEYAKYLTVEDWDKKETDDLLALAEKFALNFVGQSCSVRARARTHTCVRACVRACVFCRRV